MRALVIVVLVAATAHAERRRNDLHGARVLVLRVTNDDRWELGTGASTGWRTLADLHLRYHVTDRWSLAARERFDGEGPRVHEVELGYVVGRGKMMLPGDLFTRADLVLDAGGGVASVDRTRGVAFAGARLRFQPAPMLAIELGERESWVPLAPASIARSIAPAPPARGFATEVMASVAVMWPFFERRSCAMR